MEIKRSLALGGLASFHRALRRHTSRHQPLIYDNFTAVNDGYHMQPELTWKGPLIILHHATENRGAPQSGLRHGYQPRIPYKV